MQGAHPPVQSDPQRARLLALAALLLGSALFVCLCAACCGFPYLVGAHYKSKRGELAFRIAEIREAEVAYHKKHGRYLPLDSEAVARQSGVVGAGRGTWTPGPAWEKLDWRPPRPQRGAYWVEVNDQGFEVHGICDLDGDGAVAHFSATGRSDLSQHTDDDIY